MKIKCWSCGRDAEKTSRGGVFPSEHFVCYCRECYEDFVKTENEENAMYVYLKHKRMLDSAIHILEDQKTDMYRYREAIDAVSDHIKENPDKYDSAYEVVAAIVLIQNRIRVKMQYAIGRYRVDFYLPDLGIILEIDGDRHRYNKTKDNKRDATIKNIIGRDIDIIRIKTEFLYQNARKLPIAIREVHKYHSDGKINWKDLYG